MRLNTPTVKDDLKILNTFNLGLARFAHDVIETLYKILKSGCRAEASKLRTAERIVNLTGRSPARRLARLLRHVADHDRPRVLPPLANAVRLPDDRLEHQIDGSVASGS